MTITEIQTLIGSTSHLVTVLCTHNNVNKFSRYKPIEWPSNLSITTTNFADANYGLIVQEAIDDKNSYGAEWYYNRPYLYAKRMRDFDSYYHAAPIALLQKKGTTFTVNRFEVGGVGTIPFDILSATVGYETSCLTVGDITPQSGSNVLLGHHYLAAAIYQGNDFKGRYYSKLPISYSTLEMKGASICLSDSPAVFNSEDPYIESYKAGSYDMYLYITDYAVDPLGELRHFWPINFTTAYPGVIATTILGLDTTFELELIGVKPTGSNWLDGGSDFRNGTISYASYTTLAQFDIKYTIKNVSATQVVINLANIRSYFYRISAWNLADPVTISRDYAVMGAGLLYLDPNVSAEIISTIWAFPQPAEAPSWATVGTLDLVAKIYYGTSESDEQFTENPTNTISFEYNWA